MTVAEKTVGREHLDYATYLNGLALNYKKLGRCDDAIEKYEEALTIAEKTIGNEHPEYATFLSNLAGVYQLQGNLKLAEELFRQVKDIRERFSEIFIPTRLQVIGGLRS